jgi:hypothetical protein
MFIGLHTCTLLALPPTPFDTPPPFESPPRFSSTTLPGGALDWSVDRGLHLFGLINQSSAEKHFE